MSEVTAGEPASSSQGPMERTPIRSLNILDGNGVDVSRFGRSRPSEEMPVPKHAPFHLPDPALPYGNTSFFRDPFPMTAERPTPLPKSILETNACWKSKPEGYENTINDPFELRFEPSVRDRWQTVKTAIAESLPSPPTWARTGPRFAPTRTSTSRCCSLPATWRRISKARRTSI